MRGFSSLLVTLAIVPGGAGTALAVPVAFEYGFEVTSDFAGFPAPVSIAGVAEFDTDAPLVEVLDFTDLGFGVFYRFALTSHLILVDGITITTDRDFVQLIDDDLRRGVPSDYFSILSTVNYDLGGGVVLDSVGAFLEGPGSLISDATLFVPDAADFTTSQGGAVSFHLVSGSGFGISSPLASVRVTVVPEPGSLALMSATLGVMGLLVRRRGTVQAVS